MADSDLIIPVLRESTEGKGCHLSKTRFTIDKLTAEHFNQRLYSSTLNYFCPIVWITRRCRLKARGKLTKQ